MHTLVGLYFNTIGKNSTAMEHFKRSLELKSDSKLPLLSSYIIKSYSREDPSGVEIAMPESSENLSIRAATFISLGLDSLMKKDFETAKYVKFIS